MSTARSGFGTAVRFGLPTTLIILGILAIAGCIYIPVPEHPRTTKGQDVRELLGAERTNKPIRPGLGSRELVLQVLGNPDVRTEHDYAFAYRFSAVAGHRFGLCVADDQGGWAVPTTDRVNYFLSLRFDRRGVLNRYQLKRASSPADADAEWRELKIEVSNEDRVRG